MLQWAGFQWLTSRYTTVSVEPRWPGRHTPSGKCPVRAASPVGELSPPTPQAKHLGAFIHVERPGVAGCKHLVHRNDPLPTVGGFEVPWTLTRRTRLRAVRFLHTRAVSCASVHVGARWRTEGRDRSRHASPAFPTPAVSVVVHGCGGCGPREGQSGDLLSLALNVTGREGDRVPALLLPLSRAGRQVLLSLDIQTVMISFVFRVRSDLLR